MKTYYFTFSLKHPLHGYVQRVLATDEFKARETMVAFYGHKWAFCYSSNVAKVDYREVVIKGYSYQLIPYDLHEGETL